MAKVLNLKKNVDLQQRKPKNQFLYGQDDEAVTNDSLI